ncbi:MAG: DUF6677 family protein [Pirellulaceae bacterium]
MAKKNTKPQAKTVQSSSAAAGDVVMADGEPLNLRNRYLAAFLAWIIPGAGHYYQRRYFKAAVFFVCIISSFLIGMLVAGNRCVYASWNQTEVRWQYVLQAGIGLPAMPAAYQAWRIRSNEDPIGTFMVAPRHTWTLDSWHRETASGFDMGTLYTMIAGLLNILAVFDAYAGPLPPPLPKSKSPKKGEDPDPESADVKQPDAASSS